MSFWSRLFGRKPKHRYGGIVEAEVTTPPAPVTQVEVATPWRPILGEQVYLGGGSVLWQVRSLGPYTATLRSHDSLGRTQTRVVAIDRLRSA